MELPKRWFLVTVATVFVVVGFYFGSLVYSLTGLMNAVQSGDGADVVARTDMKELRELLTDQLVRAYLKRVGNPNPLQRMLANTYGASVSDAMLQKFLTAENITDLLRTGKTAGGSGNADLRMAPLSRIDVTKLTDLLGRLKLIQPIRVEIRTSDATDFPDGYSAIGLHFESGTWKLASVTLPQGVLAKLSQSLPVK